jgi:hypothetical protein
MLITVWRFLFLIGNAKLQRASRLATENFPHNVEKQSKQLIFNKNTLWINFSTVWITECGKKLQAAGVQEKGAGNERFGSQGLPRLHRQIL